jgi:hypothetical protein
MVATDGHEAAEAVDSGGHRAGGVSDHCGNFLVAWYGG